MTKNCELKGPSAKIGLIIQSVHFLTVLYMG